MCRFALPPNARHRTKRAALSPYEIKALKSTSEVQTLVKAPERASRAWSAKGTLEGWRSHDDVT